MLIMNSKAKLYFAAVMAFIVTLAATALCTNAGIMTIYDACWQTIVCVLSGLWFWNLMRIEITREARRRR